MSKKMNVNIEGVLDLSDGFIKLDVQGVDKQVLLAELINEFDGKTVKITVAYGEEL